MKTVSIVEAKSRFSSLVADVEAGEEIAVTRHGKVVARLVPDRPLMAAEIFRPYWVDPASVDLAAPADAPAEAAPSLDD